MPELSTCTQSLLLKTVLEQRMAYRYEKQRYTSILFIDFTGAYDNVDRELLLSTLRQGG